MAKNFSPRLAKKERKVIDLEQSLGPNLFTRSDNKLLQGARLDDVRLSDIVVKEQVRTKFNDKSIHDLAENIRVNGLIQPLVIHRVGSRYTLICGERRYRAMTSIEMKFAPCFILEDKTPEELMAIQFSENSSREELHYIDKADGIFNYHLATDASERKIVVALGISKTEVHRSLLLARLPREVKEAAKTFDIEKYVLLEFDLLAPGVVRSFIQQEILEGNITKRSELKKALKGTDFTDLPSLSDIADWAGEETNLP